MAIFKFKLKALHRLKKQIEDQEKNKFSLAAAELNAEVAKLNNIKSSIAAAVGEFRRLSGERFTAAKIKDFNYYIAAMKENEARQTTVVEAALKKIEEARKTLTIASQQRAMFDKLQEKAFMRYMIEERLAEQRIVDELVSYRGNNRTEQYMLG